MSLKKLPAAASLSSLRELASDPHLSYFYLELPGLNTAQGQIIDRYLHVQSKEDRNNGRVPMNFGREVMAELIGAQDKVNWQACVVSREEEERLARALRRMLEAI